MIIAMFALAFQTAAVPPASSSTAGKWGVDYSPTRCLINRRFNGSGPSAAMLAIDADPVDGTGRLILLLPHGSARGSFGTATIEVMPGDMTIKPKWFARTGKDGMLAIDISATSDDWEVLRSAATLTVRGPTEAPISVPFQGIDKAIGAAKTCGRGLLKSWGADPDAMIDADPQAAAKWVKIGDYPQAALATNQQGTVKLLLSVGSDGRPATCKAVVSSGSSLLDSTACTVLMDRAHFDPSAMATRYLYTKVTWAIPG